MGSYSIPIRCLCENVQSFVTRQTGKLDTGSTAKTSIQAHHQDTWNAWRLKIVHQRKAWFLSLFCMKNFFKMVSLFAIFVFEDSKQLLSHLYEQCFSYMRTKSESPAGDQVWQFSCQRSIFGRIGDQWVAVSSPDFTTLRILTSLARFILRLPLSVVFLEFAARPYQGKWTF